MNLAVIPARGGSKRIPRKNIKEFCGKPIIAWSIEAALSSGCFDTVVVSTDDEEIAEVARAAGASTPFMRPASLSDDHAGTMPVLAHAVQWFIERGQSARFVCCLYATAPLMQADDIRKGLSLLEGGDADFAVAVTTYPHPIQRALRLTADGHIVMWHPDQFNVRSQDLPCAYHDAGQFYWGRAQAWLDQRPVFSRTSMPVVLPRHRVEDIDTPDDWLRAEWLFRSLRGN